MGWDFIGGALIVVVAVGSLLGFVFTLGHKMGVRWAASKLWSIADSSNEPKVRTTLRRASDYLKMLTEDRAPPDATAFLDKGQ
jgi:autotransporter translocation and assembly factor TamB